MKIKCLIFSVICLLGMLSFAQTNAPKQTQFLLIVRSKAAPPAEELIAPNIRHWQEFMGSLAKEGILAGGYRPGNEGETLSGAEKKEKKGSYIANEELVSSFLVINAADMASAKKIAARCPVFELQGSVEIRPMQNTAR